MKRYRPLGLFVLLCASFGAQSLVGRAGQPAAGPVAGGSPFETLHFRPIGPAGMSGRLADLGVYNPPQGPRSWKQVRKITHDPCATHLLMDPTDNRVLSASTYQRRRTPCCMNGGGPGSGLWKSTNAGETWTRIKGGGFPDGPLGRIGFDVYRKRSSILYAVIEGPDTANGRGGRGAAAAPDEAPPPPAGRSNVATTVTPTTPTGVYRSDDGGTSWKKVNDENPRPMYFSQVRIDPNDPDVIIYAGVKLHHSTDGGKTINTNATQTI